MPMQKITVRLSIEEVPDELRESLRKAGITTLPQSVSVTALTDDGAEITTIYGIEAPPPPPVEKAIKQEKIDRNDERHLQNLKDTLKDERLWISQEQNFISREDHLIRGMDTRSPDYPRRLAALKARKANLTTRSNAQGARRQQILSGNTRAKQAKQAMYLHPNSRPSSALVHSVQQRLPTVFPTSHEEYRSQAPPPGLKGSYDYSTAPWNPPQPPPPPASAFRPYQPGMFDFDKFIPSSTPKYVDPPKTFNFDKVKSGTAAVKSEPPSLGQAGAMHPSRLALLKQDDEPEVIFKTEGEIYFPSSSYQFGGGNTFDRTGANMEPLARKRPSPSKEEPLAKKHAPSRMGEWTVGVNVTPAKFKPAPSILHGYVAPVSLQNAHPLSLECTAKYQAPVEFDTVMDFGHPVSPRKRVSFDEIVPASQAPPFSSPEVDIEAVATSSSLVKQLAEIAKAVDRMAESSSAHKLDSGIEDVSSELPSSKVPSVLEESVPKFSQSPSENSSSKDFLSEFSSSKISLIFEQGVPEFNQPLSENSGIRDIPSGVLTSKVPSTSERSVAHVTKLSGNIAPGGEAVGHSGKDVSGASQLLEKSASITEIDISAMYEVRESHGNSL